MNPWAAIPLFATGLVLDVCWALWTRYVVDRRSCLAAIAAFATCLPMMWTAVYAHAPVFVLPYAAGAAVGTWLTARRKRDRGVGHRADDGVGSDALQARANGSLPGEILGGLAHAAVDPEGAK